MSSLRNRLKGESIDCNLGLVLDFDLGVVVVLELDPGVRSSTILALFAGEANPKKKVEFTSRFKISFILAFYNNIELLFDL